MTDLMQALYTFAQKNHAAKQLSCDMEYQDSVDCARKGEQALRATLTADQNERLDALLGEQFIYHSAELEAMFPVSYTHLDVYKRQKYKWARWVSIGPMCSVQLFQGGPGGQLLGLLLGPDVYKRQVHGAGGGVWPG